MRFFATTKSILRSVAVFVGIVVLTSVSIDATDSFRNSQSALSIVARRVTNATCPSGTTEVFRDDKTLCIDMYEASVDTRCTVTEPQSEVDTGVNANDPDCKPLSVQGRLPWRFVSRAQADQLCARAGKRLPTALEWYTAARGTPDANNTCVVTGSLQNTGSIASCISGVGAYDMVGNVWEVVADTVVNKSVEGQPLPETGYVSAVTTDGLPETTTSAPNVIYNNDYFWSEGDGTYAIMRGGYYGSGEDGGMYSAHADIPVNFSSAAVGFRCIKML